MGWRLFRFGGYLVLVIVFNKTGVRMLPVTLLTGVDAEAQVVKELLA